jgi:hypothetical protein
MADRAATTCAAILSYKPPIELPVVVIAARITIEIIPAIRPYSMEVEPESSAVSVFTILPHEKKGGPLARPLD